MGEGSLLHWVLLKAMLLSHHKNTFCKGYEEAWVEKKKKKALKGFFLGWFVFFIIALLSLLDFVTQKTF